MSFQSKIQKPAGVEPDSFEKSVASLIFDIETNNKDLAAELKPLHITGAKEKFSDKHVLILGSRKVVTKKAAGNRKRQINQTVTAVNDAILHDLVFPSEIVGKRTRVNVDSSKLIKVFLDNKDQSTMEHKLETFTAVYKKLTGKNSSFMFSVQSE